MTTAEMFQEFQVLLDKLDTQFLEDVPIEQFLILINLTVDEYVQAARSAFETNKKIGDDVSSIVKRAYILPIIERERTKFPYSNATLTYPLPISQTPPTYSPVYYMINGVFEAVWTVGSLTKSGITEITYLQQDDITVNDPFSNAIYADKVPCVLEDHSIYAEIPSQLTLKVLRGTFIMKPDKITRTVNCNLPEQIHHTLVKRSVELALENVESIRQKTFNQ